MAPRHRLKIHFEATERGFAKVETPEVWEFDSDQAHIFNQDQYLRGHVGCPEAHVYYSYLKRPGIWSDARLSLRVLWWEYQYPDKSWWVAGAVLNEAIEGALGRFAGKLQVSKLVLEAQTEGHAGHIVKEDWAPEGGNNVILLDQRSACFSFGNPQAFPHIEKIQYYVRNSLPAGTLPPEKIYAKKTAPRRLGGGAGAPWKPDWSPKDRTGDQRYQGDSRNPNIDVLLKGLPVPRWYDAQTHAHGLEEFRSEHETGWIAAKKAGNKTLEDTICRSLWEEVSADYGSASPSLGPDYFIDGRPGFLCFLDGSLPTAGTRYRLTEVDRAALRPAVFTEGRPQIGKGDYQFTECFGRERLPYLERITDKYAGQYIGANACDFEHGGQESLVAAALILADPLAKRQLHHRSEEVLSNGLMVHSTRSSTSGWNMLALLYGVLVFDGGPWEADAERYRARARDFAQWTWDHRFDETPYQGVLTVTYEKLVIDPEDVDKTLGWEASMQIACAMNAAVVGWRIETDPFHRGVFQALLKYYGEVLQQDYIVDPSRGGILARWSLQFKADVNSTVPVSQQLELSGGAYGFRNWDSAEGWVGPAIAAASRIVPELKTFAEMIYQNQAKKIINGRLLLSPNEGDAYSMYAESVITFGFPGVTE